MAGTEMAGGYLFPIGRLFFAYGIGIRAARVKSTPRRRVGWIGNFSDETVRRRCIIRIGRKHDDRLACTYACRWEPFSVRIVLSEDGGRSWDTANELVVRDDLPNADLGYPTTIEYAPGRLFCCYYGQEPDGVTCVQGTYVELT